MASNFGSWETREEAVEKVKELHSKGWTNCRPVQNGPTGKWWVVCDYVNFSDPDMVGWGDPAAGNPEFPKNLPNYMKMLAYSEVYKDETVHWSVEGVHLKGRVGGSTSDNFINPSLYSGYVMFAGPKVVHAFIGSKSYTYPGPKNKENVIVYGVLKEYQEPETPPAPEPETPPAPEPEKPKSDYKILWESFFSNPSVYTLLGSMTASNMEAFSRVFTGYSVIEDKEIPPLPGHFASVGLILAGLTTAAIAGIFAIIPVLAPSGVLPAVASKLHLARESVDLGYIEPGVAITENTLKSAIQQVYGYTPSILNSIISEFKAHPLLTILGFTIMFQQLDVAGWGFGLFPESIHRKAETLLKSIRAHLINLDDMVKKKDWNSANALAGDIKVEIADVVNGLEALPAAFWEKFGFDFTDKEHMLNSMQTEFNAYLNQYPQLQTIPVIYPDEIVGKVTEVIDGDTVKTPGHPPIRFIGIDAHESGTAAGKVETDYLKSLIDGKTVSFKIDPYTQTDQYGRILAVPFLGEENIIKTMLAKFGKNILTPTKYQDRYRYVDWDELKEIAETVAPSVVKVKIYTKPAYGSIWIDGEDTGKIAIETFEMKPGETREITIKKAGYVVSPLPYTVPGHDAELRIELVPTSEVVPGKAKLKITSTPSRANIWLDGEFTHKLTPETFVVDVNKDHNVHVDKTGYYDQEKLCFVPPAGAERHFNLSETTLGSAAESPQGLPPEEETPAEKFTIAIDSFPSRAKLYIDGVYTHHLTPSNEKELSDVMFLLNPGNHTIRMEKGGKAAETEVDIVPGANPPIIMYLSTVGLPVSRESIEKEIAAVQTRLEQLQVQLAES